MVASDFSDNTVHVLQFLDVVKMKDPTQKAHFYRNTLRDVLPFIPRVNILTIENSIYENIRYTIHQHAMLNAQCSHVHNNTALRAFRTWNLKHPKILIRYKTIQKKIHEFIRNVRIDKGH